jgi:hypothetical protein
VQESTKEASHLLMLQYLWGLLVLGLLVEAQHTTGCSNLIWPPPAASAFGIASAAQYSGLVFAGQPVTPLMAAAFNRYAKILQLPPNDRTNSSAPGPTLQVNFIVLDPAIVDLGINTSYSYNISFDAKSSPSVRVVSDTSFGAMYALETLSQLIEVQTADQISICSSAFTINDSPSFKWRGILIDTGRRFFPKALLEQILDAMSYSKMNVLHLHFAEEGGFRVESKVHPLALFCSSSYSSSLPTCSSGLSGANQQCAPLHAAGGERADRVCTAARCAGGA